MVGLFDHRRLDVSMCTLYPHGPNRHTFIVDNNNGEQHNHQIVIGWCLLWCISGGKIIMMSHHLNNITFFVMLFFNIQTVTVTISDNDINQQKVNDDAITAIRLLISIQVVKGDVKHGAIRADRGWICEVGGYKQQLFGEKST